MKAAEVVDITGDTVTVGYKLFDSEHGCNGRTEIEVTKFDG